MSYMRSSIFDNEATEPVEINKELLNEEIIHRGWLMKRGGFKGGMKNWKKRFFVLYLHNLIYYRNQKLDKPLGMLTTKNISTTNMGDESSGNFAFVTYERTMYIRSESREVKIVWFNAIKILQKMLLEESRQRARSVSNSDLPKPSEEKNDVIRVVEFDSENSYSQTSPEINKSAKEGNTESSKENISVETPSEEISKKESFSQAESSETAIKSAKDRSEMNTLNAILEDDMGTDYFSKYLSSEYCEAQLSFWLEVRNFVTRVEEDEKQGYQVEKRESLLNMSIDICARYVFEGMDTTINIGKRLRDPLLKWNDLSIVILEKGDFLNWSTSYTSIIFEDVIKIFQKSQNDVFKMLRNSYRRFKKSKEFKELQEDLIKNTEMATQTEEPTRGQCLRNNCSCQIFVNKELMDVSKCADCDHFYEEHQNLNEEKNEPEESEGKKTMISIDQRRKLQMLLGKSFNEFTDVESDNKRKEFLLDNLTAIINHPSDPLKIKSQRFKLTKYKRCFIGKHLSTKLQKRLNISNGETLSVISEMMDHKIFKPVEKSQTGFIDGKFYYQFSAEASKEIQKRSICVEYESADEEKSVEYSVEVTKEKVVKEEKNESEDSEIDETAVNLFQMLANPAETLSSAASESEKSPSSDDEEKKIVVKEKKKRKKRRRKKRRKKNESVSSEEDSSSNQLQFFSLFGTKRTPRNPQKTKINKEMFKKVEEKDKKGS